MKIRAGGEPFLYPGGKAGCLLVHGFPGAPQEMRWLGDFLHQLGYTVLGIRLFGHATEPADLLRVQARDWLANLEDGYHLLRGMCPRIFLIGLSLGGVLSATFAHRRPLDGLVLMATPWDLPPLARRLRPILPLVKKVWSYRTPPKGSDWFDKSAEALNIHYTVQPTHAIGQIYDLVKELPDSLSQLRLPILLIYSLNDNTAPWKHGQLLHDAIPSDDKRLLFIEGSGHTLPRDAKRDEVFAAVGGFIQRVNKGLP
jgi:carboxylesterase